jgi:hypothetical protein
VLQAAFFLGPEAFYQALVKGFLDAHTFEEMEKTINDLFDGGTVVYGLIVKAAIGKVFNVMFLGQLKGVNEFVEQTGGEMVGADKKEVDTKLSEVIDRLRARYALGFRPTNSAGKDVFHRVEIKVSSTRKGKEKPAVLTKRGYYLRKHA